jgi:hypothetical protein
MQIIRFAFAISSLVTLFTHAAPISVLDGSDSLEARDGDTDLWRRSPSVPVGPGVRHPSDAAGANFHPMPPGTYVKTHDRVYSHHEVNAAATRLFHHALPAAPDYHSNRQRTGARTYPKASSGFRPTEHAHDPAHGFDQSYHYPMVGRPGPAHRNPTTGRVSMRVGTDRIVAWKNHADTHYNIGVSYHDPKRPVPATSNNHPFSHAQVKRGGPVKIQAAKAKKAVQRGWRKATGKH